MRRRRTTPHEKGYTYRRGKILERRRPTEYCPRACKGNCTQVSGRTTPWCLISESRSCEHEEYTVQEQTPPRMLPLKERKRAKKSEKERSSKHECGDDASKVRRHRCASAFSRGLSDHCGGRKTAERDSHVSQ